MSRVDRSRLPVPGPNPPFHFHPIVKRRLANGLDVWTVSHADFPVVSAILVLPIGAAADPLKRPGLAALTSDMLDEGSGSRSAIDMHDALARIGAIFDVETSPDATIVSLTTLAKFTDAGLSLLADMVIRPRLAELDFERVRALRLNRLLQLRDVPGIQADRVFARRLYGTHPYGHLGLGTEDSLRGMELGEVAAFHGCYRAAEASLILVGGRSHDELQRTAEAIMSDWPLHEGSPAAYTVPVLGPPADAHGNRFALVPRPNAAQSELRVGHVSADRSTPDYHALLVLNMLLGGQFVSRINSNLREQKGYTYGMRTQFDCRRGPGPFVTQGSVQTDATADSIKQILDEIRGVRTDRAPTPDELELAKAGLTRGFPRSFETAEQTARAASQMALYELPDDYFSTFVPTVEAVDESTVQRAAQVYLDPERLHAVIVGDADKVQPQLEQFGFGRADETTTS